MDVRERVEKYLVQLALTFERVGENTWMVQDTEKGLENVVIMAEDPVVVVRVKVMDLPKSKREALYEDLLRLNASDLVQGAYGVEGDSVILLNTLLAATMDFEEFQSTLDAIGLALSQHYAGLSKYRN